MKTDIDIAVRRRSLQEQLTQAQRRYENAAAEGADVTLHKNAVREIEGELEDVAAALRGSEWARANVEAADDANARREAASAAAAAIAEVVELGAIIDYGTKALAGAVVAAHEAQNRALQAVARLLTPEGRVALQGTNLLAARIDIEEIIAEAAKEPFAKAVFLRGNALREKMGKLLGVPLPDVKSAPVETSAGRAS